MTGKWTRELFLERFVPKIEFTGHCWLWKRGPGYCRMWWRNEPMLVHRLSYAFFNGPLLPEHEIHHMCKTRSCVNPDHLAQCRFGQHREFHSKNSPTCPKGHLMEGRNVLINSKGNRQCRKCHRDAALRTYHRYPEKHRGRKR